MRRASVHDTRNLHFRPSQTGYRTCRPRLPEPHPAPPAPPLPPSPLASTHRDSTQSNPTLQSTFSSQESRQLPLTHRYGAQGI